GPVEGTLSGSPLSWLPLGLALSEWGTSAAGSSAAFSLGPFGMPAVGSVGEAEVRAGAAAVLAVATGAAVVAVVPPEAQAARPRRAVAVQAASAARCRRGDMRRRPFVTGIQSWRPIVRRANHSISCEPRQQQSML